MDEPEGFTTARPTLELRTQEQLRAVSNLARHQIIDLLRKGEVSISGVAAKLAMKKGSASYHLRLLERAGIVTVTRTRQVRGVQQRFYALTAERLVWPDPVQGAAANVLRAMMNAIDAVPPSPEQLVGRRQSRVSAARYKDFYARLLGLLEEFDSENTEDAEHTQLGVVLFRDGQDASSTGSKTEQDNC